jgi:hypothetical protein
VLDKEIPLWKAMNFPRCGGRSRAGKRRMREIRPSGDRRKGPLLNSGAARIGASEILQFGQGKVPFQWHVEHSSTGVS